MLLILFDQWAGHRLLSEKVTRPHVRANRPILIPSVKRRACATPVSMQNGATVGARLSPPCVHSRTAGPAQKTSTTLTMYCNWRNAMVTGPRESASAPRKECRQQGPSTNNTSCTVGSRQFPTTAHNQRDLHKNSDHLVNVLQQGWNYGLLNSKTMGIRLCTTTGNNRRNQKASVN